MQVHHFGTHAIFSAVNHPMPLTEEQVLAACGEAIRLAPTEFPPTLPPSKELSGAPEWYPFERQAWPIGESIRQAFAKNPKLKKTRNRSCQ